MIATTVFKDRTSCLSLILEGQSGAGKTAPLHFAFPLAEDPKLSEHIYRSDKFTPKSFVSHSANVSEPKLKQIDLLTKLKGKTLLCKEFSPILQGKPDEVRERYATLIAVLDGKGHKTDSGIRGSRGYEEAHIFNLIAASTPWTKHTHRMMGALGTRLLIYEVIPEKVTKGELMRFVKRGASSKQRKNARWQSIDF